ncbi:MAG: DUF3817 domain-containing protein [Algisphaera sp.]
MNESQPFDPVRLLRHVGRLEGISFLLLLGVAMPLKYLAGYSEATKMAGWGHGVLFMAFLAVWLWSLPRLPWKWALAALVAAVVPLGPFWVDSRLRQFEGD